jgi:NifU-like protein involved in Fe-S cluster formation
LSTGVTPWPIQPKVVDHYENPRNVGSFEKGDESVGTGMVGAPACGDVMKLQIKVNPQTGVIEDARFKTYGCGSAIASSSLVTEWVKGKTLDQAASHQERADRRRTGAAAGEDPLLDPGRGRHQGGRRRLQEEARA